MSQKMRGTLEWIAVLQLKSINFVTLFYIYMKTLENNFLLNNTHFFKIIKIMYERIGGWIER